MSLTRRSLQIVALLATFVVGAASMAVIVTQTTWFKEWLRGFIVRQAEDYVNGRLSIGRLDGNLFFGVELEDVDVTVNGEKVVDIKDVGLDYNMFTLIGGDVVLDDIRLNQPVLRLYRTADGWNLTELIKARTPDPDEPKNRRTLEIGEIGISDGTVFVDDRPVGTSGVAAPRVIEKLDASIGVKTNEDALTVAIGHVSLRAQQPDLGVNAMSGVIVRSRNEVTLQNVSIRTEQSELRVDGTIENIEGGQPVLDLTASSGKLALNELAQIVPALRGYELQPAFELTATGPVDKLAVDVNVREGSIGQAVGDLTVDATGPDRRVAGSASVQNLNVGPIVRNPTLRSNITGTARFDLALPSGRQPLRGSYAVRAASVDVAGYRARNVVADGRIDGRTVGINNGRADAYGGHATARGTVRAGQPLALDLRGHATRVDLRNLPPVLNAPGVASSLNFDYSLTGRGRVFSGDVRLDASTLAGATIAEGSTGRFRIGGGAPEYAAKGQVVNLDVQQVGRGFGISALTTDRFRSTISGTFDVTGSGGGRYPLTLDATGTVVDSQMFGATFPRLDFTTTFAGGDARVRTVGEFAGLDPSIPTANERLTGMITGNVNAETTIRNYGAGVTPESIDITGQLNLTDSTLGGLAIDTASVDGHYANREGQLTQLSIMGPDVNVTGKGNIALNETGASNLTFHAETASLERVGAIIGQPLKGAAVVDATVTGNARDLRTQGTLKGSNVGYRENTALALDSTFTLAIPDLTPENATIQAKSTATFLEIGGQKITELAADTTYAAKRLEFNATAKEGMREIEAAGNAVFHPEHQEIHLGNVALRSEGIEWRSNPGSEATVQYGRDRIVVDNLQLVNADQRISADGVIGSTTESLRVRAENVDVAQLDRLVLGDQRLAGRLTANATVSGSLDAPRVAGDFTLANGAFRMFKFESLAGSVDYAQRGVNMDVRLQQTPTAWLTAKGYAPLTLFRANPPGIESGGHDAPAEGEAIDLQIASSQIDLGVIQGFTSYVTDVTGVMQANVRVTGSGYDPHVNGAIDIRGGAFAVPDLGTNYTGLDTRIDLQQDQLNIQEFKILDSRGFPMTVGGTLSVHEREVGAVNITMKSENFEVIDNRLADLKLDTDLKITGELRKPRVEGFVEVENGTIHIAELLDQVTADAYATESIDLAGADAAARAAAAEAEPVQPPPPTIFDALVLNVGLAIPSNLVIRGNDLRPANAPIEMGDMNATVGGAVQIQKSAGGKVRFVGEVNTVRGNYTFQGRRFEILRDGRIRFDGSEDIDPSIDLRARRIISGVETFVRVQGTMRQPEMTFSSNPPLDQADILSLIVFNQPVNELGEGQQASLVERAGALAGGYLASGLAQSIGNALDLDEFEIQTGEGFGPSLTVGEQVGEHIFVRLRQAFGEAQATEFIIEYQLKDYLRLQATAADASGNQRLTFRRVERGGIDLIFFFSY